MIRITEPLFAEPCLYGDYFGLKEWLRNLIQKAKKQQQVAFRTEHERDGQSNYSSRDQTVHFAYVTSFWVEGNQTHIGLQCKPKTLPTKELRQRATNYCRWEIMFIVWTVGLYASLSATSPIPLPFTSNGHGTHKFFPTSAAS
jgi:hypothetical protein